MAKKSNAKGVIVLILVLGIAALLVYAWKHHRESATGSTSPGTTGNVSENAPLAVASDSVVPSHDGRTIALSGKLDVRTPARDTQLGVSADAVMLLRFVEMHQWYEQCAGGACEYKKVWSPQLINSHKFHETEGHQNPERLPLTTARFSAPDVRLGAFRIDAATIGNYRLSAALNAQPVPYPVTNAQLPSNLAISFRDSNGALFSGSDPAHPAIGDVRVSYRIIPATNVDLTGI
ncbi:MAG: TMEM43 family protein, partial [Rhodanobacteraceae bacterium]